MRESYHQSAMDFVDKVTYTPSQKQHVHWPLPEEMWDRRSKFPNQLHKVPNQLGSYQHQRSPACSKNMCSQNDTQKDRSASMPVKKKAQNIATGLCNSICRFANRDSNCWLNATLQSILYLQDKLKNLSRVSLVQMSSMPEQLAALIEVSRALI